MAKINVNVEQKHGKNSVRLTVTGFAPIEVEGKLKYERLSYSLGTIDVDGWDEVISRPTREHSKKDGGMLHRSIDRTCSLLERAFVESPEKTMTAVRSRYEDLAGLKTIKVVKASLNAVAIVRAWENEAENYNTMRSYRVFASKLEEYQKKKAAILDLDKMKQGDLLNLMEWLAKRDGINSNSQGTQRKHINKLVNQVRKKHGLSHLMPIEGFRFRTTPKEVLDWSDVRRIVDHTPATKSEADYRVLCLLYLLTSIRISDTWQCLKAIEVRNNILCSTFRTTKGDVEVSPIIFEPLRVALEANGGEVAYRTEQLIRRGIAKLLAKLELPNVQVHSMRRSFVGNFLFLGLSDHSLAKVFTSHSMNSGDSKIFHSYNHSSLAVAQRSILNQLRNVPLSETCGVELLSDKVC
ncbi:MAG TPA: hypothetical protein VGE21_01470 [Flavobacteriales bacterium]